MAAVQRKLVHKQFNSPMGLYSQQNVKETLDRELNAFGDDGIEVDEQITKPLNLANSAVLRAVEEEEEMKCGLASQYYNTTRPSRARQRHTIGAASYVQLNERPHTPLHQQQLTAIKTQYATQQQQHDIVIDRDTVLRINRLATRRNLNKRDHSWPPPHSAMQSTQESDANGEAVTAISTASRARSRSSTTDGNVVHFDVSVCRRHAIEALRERFSSSPTYIVEPTAQEVRNARSRQKSAAAAAAADKVVGRATTMTTKKQQQRENKSNFNTQLDSGSKNSALTNVGNKHGHTSSSTSTSTSSSSALTTQKVNDVVDDNRKDWTQWTAATATEMKNAGVKIDEEIAGAADDIVVGQTPHAKGFSAPETIAADENIGLVEPRRQYYEQLCHFNSSSGKRWHSTENIAATRQLTTLTSKVPTISNNRQSYSLERGRTLRQRRRQLPPLKPRVVGSSNGNNIAAVTKSNLLAAAMTTAVPKLKPQQQRRAIKVATEIKISYDTGDIAAATDGVVGGDGDGENVRPIATQEIRKQVDSLDTSKISATSAVVDLEHIPLPATPTQAIAATNQLSHELSTQDGAVATMKRQQQQFQEKNSKKLHCNAVEKQQQRSHIVPVTVEPRDDNDKRKSRVPKRESTSTATAIFPSAQQIYDDACIYLRSIDSQQKTVAYIPAAITIVPSPTDEMLQRWGQQSQTQLQAEIGDCVRKEQEKVEAAPPPPPPPPVPAKNSSTTLPTTPKTPTNTTQKLPPMLQQLNANLATTTAAPTLVDDKLEYVAYVNKLHHTERAAKATEAAAKDDAVATKSAADERTYVTASHGIQLARQPSVSKSRKSTPTTPTTPTIAAVAANAADENANKFGATQKITTELKNATTSSSNFAATTEKRRPKGIYYTDGEYLFGPFESGLFENKAANENQLTTATKVSNRISLNHGNNENVAPAAAAPSTTDESHGVKYDDLQKSIAEHLRQIEAYMATAKLALSRSLQQQQQQIQQQQTSDETKNVAVDVDVLRLFQSPSPTPILIVETPLQSVVRQILSKSIEEQQQQNQAATLTVADSKQIAAAKLTENVPVVEQALLDLANITLATTEMSAIAKSKKIAVDPKAMETPTALVELKQFARPEVAKHVSIIEEVEVVSEKEEAKSQKAEEIDAAITKNAESKQSKCIKDDKTFSSSDKEASITEDDFKIEHVAAVIANYEQLSAARNVQSTDLPETATALLKKESPAQQLKSLNIATAQTYAAEKEKSATAKAFAKADSKNLVTDYITQRKCEEELVDQVIDVLAAESNQQSMTAISNQFHDDNLSKQQEPQQSNIAAVAATQTSPPVPQKETHTQHQLVHHEPTIPSLLHDDTKPYAASTCPICAGSATASKATWGKLTLGDRWRLQNQQGGKVNDMFDTYQATYEIRSPYISRQISWEDTLENTPSTGDRQKNELVLITTEAATESNKSNDMKSTAIEKSNAVLTATDQSTLSVESLIPPPPPPPPPPPSQYSIAPVPPIRRYPAPLIEPSAPPARAASPFGLNPVNVLQEQERRSRTHSPTPGRVTNIQSASADDKLSNNSYMLVPQVEGHNIGLLVRTAIMPSIGSNNNSESRNAAAAVHDNFTAETDDANITTDDDDELACVSSTAPVASASASAAAAVRACNRNAVTKTATADDSGIGGDGAGGVGTHVGEWSEQQQRRSLSQPPPFEYLMEPATKLVATSNIDLTADDRNSNDTLHYLMAAQQHQQQQQQQQPQQQDSNSSSSSAINRLFDNVSPRPYAVAIEGYKRVAWPPVSEERIIREFTPQPAGQFPPPQQCNPTQHQQQQHQASAAAPASAPGTATAPATQQGPIYNNVQPAAVARQPSPYPHQQQYPQQQQQPPYQSHYQQPNQPQAQYQQPPSHYQQQPQYQPAAPPAAQQEQQPVQYTQSQYQRQPSREAAYEPTQQRQQTPQYESTNPYQQQQQQHPAAPYATGPSGWKPIRPPVAQSSGYVNPNQYQGSVGSEQNYTSPQQQQQQPNRAPSYDQYQSPTSQQPHQQQQQQQYQPQYNHPPSSQQNNYQQQPQSAAQQQPQPQYQGQAYQQPQQQVPSWAHQQQPQQQVPSWGYQQQQQQQPQVAAPLQQQQQQPNQYQPQQSQYQFEPQQNHFDSYSQPQQSQQPQQQQQPQQPYPQDYRGGSPGVITLRKETPVSQLPAPVYTSQPAAVSYQGGTKLRGDLKWPPPEYKEAAVRENEERRQLALGPACRPRRINRDYTPFFAKNAINCYYPSYKVPPGTQHIYG